MVKCAKKMLDQNMPQNTIYYNKVITGYAYWITETTVTNQYYVILVDFPS